MIDRRGMHLRPPEGIDDILVDRFKFDHDDDEDEIPVYGIDLFDLSRIRYRAKPSGLHYSKLVQFSLIQQIIQVAWGPLNQAWP